MQELINFLRTDNYLLILNVLIISKQYEIKRKI